MRRIASTELNRGVPTHRQPPINKEIRRTQTDDEMGRETEAEYLARREQDQLSLALSQHDPIVARLHYTLAEKYRARLDSLPGATDGEELTSLITTPLTVDAVGGEVVLDGQLPVAAVLTPEAAMETGVQLIKTALEAESNSFTQ